MEKAKVFVFGCPRSGTTYVTEWLQAGLEADVEKLSEVSPYHPINSEWGLNEICRTKDVILIYVSRSDEGIYNSFRAARYASQNMLTEKIPSPMPDVLGIATTSDVRIKEMIRLTKENTAKQLDSVRMISIMYEMLDFEDYVCRFEDWMERAGIELKPEGILPWHVENWKKKPVRGGALSYGIKVADYE